MTTQALRNRYMTDSVTTASPARLLVMLYDRLVLDLTIAEQALDNGDHTLMSERLLHAQDIIIELRTSLDTAAWSGGPGLASLYTYLISELIQANVSRDGVRIQHCLDCVSQLRDAWREAAIQLAESGS
jgi:flagellar secretion chaperone FliS